MGAGHAVENTSKTSEARVAHPNIALVAMLGWEAGRSKNSERARSHSGKEEREGPDFSRAVRNTRTHGF